MMSEKICYQCSKCGEKSTSKNMFNCPCGAKHIWDELKPITKNGITVNNNFLWQCNICGLNPTGTNKGLPNDNLFCNSNLHPSKNQKLYHVWVFIGFPSDKEKDWQCRHCRKRPSLLGKSGLQKGIPVKRDFCSSTGKRCVWENIHNK